jgi:Galactose-1-phosphate uridylyltransferase
MKLLIHQLNGKKRLMSQIHKRTFVRNDDKEIILYGYQEHKEPASQQLDVNNILNPHMRWNPSREEWVTYSADRKNRTSFPPKEYCPLCPGANLNYPTEIPFSNFEVAVFPNRWASFNSIAENIFLEKVVTKPSTGECEVVVYSPEHLGTISEMPLKRIELLIKVWIDRYSELKKNPDVKYVLP